MLSLYKLFRDFENFKSLFGRFRFWLPTRFPEVIYPRYDPVEINPVEVNPPDIAREL